MKGRWQHVSLQFYRSSPVASSETFVSSVIEVFSEVAVAKRVKILAAITEARDGRC